MALLSQYEHDASIIDNFTKYICRVTETIFAMMAHIAIPILHTVYIL